MFTKSVMNIPQTLRNEVAAFTAFLNAPERAEPDQYELVESRLDCVKFTTKALEESGTLSTAELRSLQEWFHDETELCLGRSPMITRARNWPEGYPGDYKTLEAVYANQPTGNGVGLHLDRYFLSRTLAVAIRSRRRHLSSLLTARSAAEQTDAKWLNLACGPCRELLNVPPPIQRRTVICVDSDTNALSYAANLLAARPLGEVQFLAENAYRFANAQRNVKRFGYFSTIYSAGLFDYIPSERLSTIVGALYQSLSIDGMLIAPLKDCRRYETFDYHWGVRWHFFFQRDETEFRAIFAAAGIPVDAISVERDNSGVLLFFTIRK